MMISVVTTKGSPGATTLCLALASSWPEPVIVFDVDPQCGSVLTGLTDGAVQTEHVLVDVLVDARRTSLESALQRHVSRPVPHGPLLLGGFGAPEQAIGVDFASLARKFTEIVDADVIVDVGRFAISHPVNALLHESDLVLVVTDSSFNGVRALVRSLPALTREADDVPIALAVVDPDKPYGGQDIGRACQRKVLGEIPFDPRTAAVWSDAAPLPSRHRRRPLTRAAEQLATTIRAELDAYADGVSA
ncbi:hypothetical protein [Pseudonocardia xishanensis]|uniref:MinD-like ATPase involved in chromosome partitioning or flagellar assembly n=1 Tax=Pseudonocardia xishanensis TaxID=630995 RepID=A0ABP8RV89_9PSEU